MKSDQLQIINRQFKTCGTFLFDEYVFERDCLHLQGEHKFSDSRLSLIKLMKNPSSVIVDLTGFKGFMVFTMMESLFAKMAYFPNAHGVVRFVPHQPNLLLIPTELAVSPNNVHHLIPAIVETDVQQTLVKNEDKSDQGSGFVLVNATRDEFSLIDELTKKYEHCAHYELVDAFKDHAKLKYARVRRQGIDQIALHNALLRRFGYSPFKYSYEEFGIQVIEIADYNWLNNSVT